MEVEQVYRFTKLLSLHFGLSWVKIVLGNNKATIVFYVLFLLIDD